MRYVELSQVLLVVERSFEFVRCLKCSSTQALGHGSPEAEAQAKSAPLQRVLALLADLYPLLVELTCIPQLVAASGAFAAAREDCVNSGSSTVGQILRRVLLHYAFLLQRYL